MLPTPKFVLFYKVDNGHQSCSKIMATENGDGSERAIII